MDKILVNGCSHSQARIPNIPDDQATSFSWPILLGQNLNCEVVNLATNGKSNSVILEESMRYLLNDTEVDHAVVQLTGYHRLSLYNKKQSFIFIPGDVNSQFDRLAEQNSIGRNPRFYKKFDDFKKSYMVEGEKKYQIGDESGFYDRLTTATQLFSLYFYCKHLGIGLTVIPYDFMCTSEEIEDVVFSNIPLDIFLQDNIHYGIWDYLNTMFYQDDGHFDKDAHVYMADCVLAHMQNKDQIKINPDTIRDLSKKIIYDYSH